MVFSGGVVPVAKLGAHDDAVDDTMAMILRSKTPAERLEIAFGMWRYARNTILRIVQAEHPEWDPVEVQRETARRLLHGT
jgi:hypothetical protein